MHGVGGITGALLSGVFVSATLTEGGGPINGNFAQLLVQIKAVAVAAGYSALVAWGILKVVSLVVPLRVNKADESTGLDLSQHGEIAYASPAEHPPGGAGGRRRLFLRRGSRARALAPSARARRAAPEA